MLSKTATVLPPDQLYGPSESGKSTWYTLMRSILIAVGPSCSQLPYMDLASGVPTVSDREETLDSPLHEFPAVARRGPREF